MPYSSRFSSLPRPWGRKNREAPIRESPVLRPDASRLQWLHVVRAIVVVCSFGVVFLLHITPTSFSNAAAYTVLGSVMSLNLLWGILVHLEWYGDARVIAAIELAVDVASITILIYLTGGLTNLFAILYFFVIFGAAFVLSERWGVFAASVATATLAILHVLFYFASHEQWELPWVSPNLIELVPVQWNEIIARLIQYSLAYHGVAVLAILFIREAKAVMILAEEVLEEMGEGLMAIDKNGRILFCNGEARRILDYKGSRSVMGRNISDVFKRAEDNQILQGLLAMEQDLAEVEVETRQGTKAIEVTTTILPGYDGSARCFVSTFSDLTMRKKLEEAEQRAERLREIEEVATGLAHEIRNPLASIRGCVQELSEAENLKEMDLTHLADIICRASDRLDDIVGQFMDFARMKPTTFQMIELSPLLEDVVELLRRRPNVSEVQLATTDASPSRVYGDPGQLHQVFMNLGINALESMEEQKGKLVISINEAAYSQRIGSKEDERQVISERPGLEVAFTDNGPGIPTDDLNRIFTPFYTTKGNGTGLGLPLVNKITISHGGHVVCRSGQEEGTTFTVWLPTGLSDQITSELTNDSDGEDPS